MEKHIGNDSQSNFWIDLIIRKWEAIKYTPNRASILAFLFIVIPLKFNLFSIKFIIKKLESRY